MHQTRRWCVSESPSPEDLARKLTQHTWTLCTGFHVKGHPDYVFLNDATHEDGAGEYGILKVCHGMYWQVETITFSWCTPERALEHIQRALAGEYDAEA